MEDYQKLVYTLEAGEVQRFHACPSVIRKQTVGEHSWGVTLISGYLFKAYHGVEHPHSLLMLESLLHDVAEIETGDIPATFKWSSPEVDNASEEYDLAFRNTKTPWPSHSLSEVETVCVKLADILDALRWTQLYEPRRIVHQRYVKYFKEYSNKAQKSFQSVGDYPRQKVLTMFHAAVELFTEFTGEQIIFDTGVPQSKGYVNQD